ncbi:putative F-box/kelch-repeat protein [Abeliophyllum distichum]|uniref:F-box/kelch-repeat protein n=1 Tax=Abeliophyllum distichum TaxID=126358 RepID=A0ABD1Q7I4_9LAMI
MGNLNDDLILAVISCFPPTDAVRCKSLNKNFNAYISNQRFAHEHFVKSSHKVFNLIHFSDTSPNIFYQLQLDPPYPLDIPEIYEILSIQVPVLASCGGLLLLHILSYNTYCVFNPITGEFQLVSEGNHDGWTAGPVGLAVDSSTDSFTIRLIAVHVKQDQNQVDQVCKFTAFTVGSNMWEETHKEFVCKSSQFSRNTQPAYLHGSLHWVREDGDILAFDIEKCQARIIHGPGNRTSIMQFGYDIWFGGVQGSLAFVSAFQDEIVISVYHHENNEWHVGNIIGNISNTGNNDYRNGIPMLFDGKRLFFLLRKRGEDGEIYMHNVSTKSWRKIGMVSATTDCIQHFIPFVPTLAKVSGAYLHDQMTQVGLSSELRGSLEGLYELMKPY